MTQLDYLSASDPLGPDNRRTVLLVWGIILIIIGSLSGCVAVASPLALISVPRQQRGAMFAGPAAVAMMFAMYALPAVGFIWTGVASIRRRRWVRPLVLVFGTIWLIGGVLGLAVWIVTIPAIQQVAAATGTAPGAPAGAGAAPGAGIPPGPGFGAAMIVGAGCVGVFFVVLPALLLWFYRDPAVRGTLEFYDPEPRWTDRAPIPVLGMSCALALAALWAISTTAMRPAAMFGWIDNQPLAIVLTLLFAGLLGLAAWWTYRFRRAGWWLAVGLIVAVTACLIASWMTMDLRAMYAGLAMPESQVEAMVAMNRRQLPLQIATSIILALAALGYAVYVRRFFKAPSDQAARAAPGAGFGSTPNPEP